MASIATEANGGRLIAFYLGTDNRKFIRLGKVTMQQAQTVAGYVDDLAAAKMTSTSPKPATVEWLADIGPTLRAKLERMGLVEPRERVNVPTVDTWVEQCIAARHDLKPNTRRNYEQSKRMMMEYFKDSLLDDVTEADADGYRVHLKGQGLSEGTIRRELKRAKQFFAVAVKARIMPVSPFANTRAGNYANPDRFHFVSREDAEKVLKACPDAEWRALFALARYGGLRCPSEILALRWGDIDWEHSRFTVRSSKTEHHDGGGVRIVPLFPELLKYLEEAFEQAEPGSLYVITRYRETNANLRTQLGRIIKKAGLVPWPKLFQNCRSTRETELAETFPVHVVCKWIGNTAAIANKHYLQTTDAHFAQAVKGAEEKAQRKAQQKAQQQGILPVLTDSHDSECESRNPTEEGELCGSVQNSAGRWDSTDPHQIPPRGLEPLSPG